MDFHKIKLRELAADIPGAIAIFHQYHIEFCIRGHLPLATALQHRSDAREIIGSLMILAENKLDHTVASDDLIHELLGSFHRTQRQRFLPVIQVARCVEQQNIDHPDCPMGLAAMLSVLTVNLDTHMEKEEQTVFSALLRDTDANMHFAIQRMVYEHEDMLDQLDTVRRLAHDYVPPENSPPEWRDLYAACAKLDDDMRFYVDLENTRLFPRYTSGLAMAS